MNFLGQPVTTFPFCAEKKFSSLARGPACSSTYQEFLDQWALHVHFLFPEYFLLISFSWWNVYGVSMRCCICGNPGILLFPHVCIIRGVFFYNPTFLSFAWNFSIINVGIFWGMKGQGIFLPEMTSDLLGGEGEPRRQRMH